jgi:SAM-dependent methyltransferase
MTRPSISVIIASHDQAAWTLPLAGAREVIVVGDAAEIAGVDNASLRRVPSKASAGQRANIGISLAAGDWVVVLTGREKLAPDWLMQLSQTVSHGNVCAHRMQPSGSGLPLLAVRRPAFAYGALDGSIDNAAAALEHWLADIFPKHRHRVLGWEGSEDHAAGWLHAGADAGARTSGLEVRRTTPAGYDPQQFWEEGGRGWVKWEAFQPDEAEICSVVERIRPRCVLELGCGGGRNGRYFAQAYRYTGLDISLPLLERARDRQEANCLGLVCGDATRLPFPEASFDLVFAVSTLQHVVPARIADCVADIARVAERYVCLIEFTGELPGGTWFSQQHMFRHDYAALLAPYADLKERRRTALQIQPAVKELLLFEKR